MNYTEKPYFTMLAVYHQVTQSGNPKHLSKELLALEDIERRYCNAHGFIALMNLMFEAENRGFLVH